MKFICKRYRNDVELRFKSVMSFRMYDRSGYYNMSEYDPVPDDFKLISYKEMRKQSIYLGKWLGYDRYLFCEWLIFSRSESEFTALSLKDIDGYMDVHFDGYNKIWNGPNFWDGKFKNSLELRYKAKSRLDLLIRWARNKPERLKQRIEWVRINKLKKLNKNHSCKPGTQAGEVIEALKKGITSTGNIQAFVQDRTKTECYGISYSTLLATLEVQGKIKHVSRGQWQLNGV